MSLQVESLTFSYAKRQILRDISFTLSPGEVVSVLGANGAGKTTLFRCILGMLEGYQGKIEAFGVNVKNLSVVERAQQIAYIPQAHRPTFGYTVLDTVLMGTSRQVGAFKLPKAQQIEQSYAALERTGAAHLAERDFNSLSGGEQQLVLIARAIAQQSKILIMDEPTAALDYGNQFRVLEQVRRLADEGYAVLQSTHDPQHTLAFADRVLAISQGTTAAFGPPRQVLTPELMQALYRIDVGFVETRYGTVLVPKEVGP